MNHPLADLQRFLWACLLGFGLGIWYGFLRPLRRRFPRSADLLFCCALVPAWVYLSFAVCGGDLRLGYTAGLFVGCLLEEWTLGILLQPVFSGLWKLICRIFSIFILPIKKFFKICGIFANFLFARRKK